MSGSGYIEFKNEDIVSIANVTRNSQADWDRIWEGVRSRLSGVVSEALDALTGSSLEDRTAKYHQRTQQYTADLNSQHVAVNNVASISADTNQQMSRVISGA
jgi:preprotein translocase subunit SecD